MTPKAWVSCILAALVVYFIIWSVWLLAKALTGTY